MFLTFPTYQVKSVSPVALNSQFTKASWELIRVMIHSRLLWGTMFSCGRLRIWHVIADERQASIDNLKMTIIITRLEHRRHSPIMRGSSAPHILRRRNSFSFIQITTTVTITVALCVSQLEGTVIPALLGWYVKFLKNCNASERKRWQSQPLAAGLATAA